MLHAGNQDDNETPAPQEAQWSATEDLSFWTETDFSVLAGSMTYMHSMGFPASNGGSQNPPAVMGFCLGQNPAKPQAPQLSSLGISLKDALTR